MQLLALILQMVMADELLLLENNKFGSFVVDFLLLAEPKLELLVFQNFYCSSSRFSIQSLFENVGLQISELLESLLGALDHEVARLLQRNRMLRLGDFDIAESNLSHLGVRELHWPGFFVWESANSLQEFLLEIFALKLLQEEVCLQAVVHFGLAIEEPIGDADDRVVVSERVGVVVTSKGVRDEDFLVVLEVKNELLFDKALLEEDGPQVEDVCQFAHAQHELYFV